MCVPDVYIVKNGEKEVVFKEVENMVFKDGELVFTNISGEVYSTKASLREVNLVEHVILLEDNSGS